MMPDKIIKVIGWTGLILPFLITLCLQGCANTKEWNTLQAIHTDSLKHFHYMSDKELYDKEEYWAKPYENIYKGVKLGDCEDYAIWVQAKLAKKGFDSTVARRGTHAVLMVNGWVIDNKYTKIQRSIFNK